MNEILELDEREDGLMEPHNDSDMQMFMHCTAGSCAITYCYFQDLAPVFACHGWTMFKRFRNGKVDFIS
jgi:hypothetical protein